jgi:regulator of protease activity HflC (stomatin/prohibitin superfamily)
MRSSSVVLSGSINIKNFPHGKINTILNVCPKGEVHMVERLGKLHRVQEAGLYVAIPLVDDIKNVVDMRELVIDIEPQSGYTKDNVAAAASGTIFIQITDPVKACYNVRRVLYAIVNLACSTMRAGMGTVELDVLNHDRLALNKTVLSGMGDIEAKYGARVERFELQKVLYDDAVQKAMDKQAIAERQRREDVLGAEADKTAMERRSQGEQRAIINVAEAHNQSTILAAQAKTESIKIIAASLDAKNGHTAMNLELADKYMTMMTDTVAKAHMNTMFFPDNMADLPKVLGSAMGILGSSPSKKN